MPIRSSPIIRALVFATILTAVLAQAVRSQFVPGHVFVSVRVGEGCFGGEFEGILEIDPNTGEVATFADHDDGLCFPDGLTFTPLGDQLLVSNFGPYFYGDPGFVRSFGPDGSSAIALDGDDGLANPSGSNNVAYDRQGNLYVVTGDNWYIMRYAPDGTSEVFADADDGVVFQGSITVAPNGDVFFCSHRTDEVVRITPDGIGTLFDVPPETPWSIAVDRKGNLFVGAASTDIYFYAGALAAKRQVLAPRFASALRGIGLSLDERYLYVAAGAIECGSAALFAVDLETGEDSLLACFISSPYGLTVHINYLSDLDDDHDIDLSDFAALTNLMVDLDGDGDANVADFAVLVNTLTGP